MAINPNISLAVRGIELQDPLAQYGRVAAIQQAQQQNALANMQMQEYSRAREEDQGIRNRLAGGASLEDAETRNYLLGSKTGREILQRQSELIKAQSEDAARRAKLMQDTESMYRNMSGQISNKADAATFLQRMVNDPALKGSPIASIPLMQQIQRIPDDPQGLDNWVKQFALGTTKFITENKPSTFSQDTGSGGRLMSRPGLGGAATVVPGSEFTKSRTFADITAERNAQTSAGNLALAQERFNFEKANPGYELQQTEDGSFVGVNKRTLQAVPVTMGGAAPAAAPAAPGAGMPGPRVPAPAAQVIPGMTSVLDQPAAAPAAGVPLRGKSTALTESQGNATAYGMRMREANAILEPLEKAGKTDTGVIKGVVGGTLGLVPFIGDKLEDASGSIFNALPRVLGGLSPEQQQVMQARINFITAILRKESGAAIGANEFATAEKNYFPKPGDDAAAIAQKQQARRTAIRAMEIQAGPGAKQMGGAGTMPGVGAIPGASATNPLGLPGL